MIIVQIGGGLGNQMFRFAAAYALHLKTGEELLMSMKVFEKDFRAYSLQHLNIGEVPICDAALEEKVYRRKRRMCKLHRWNVTRYEDSQKAARRGYLAMGVRPYVDADMTGAKVKYITNTCQSNRYFAGYEKEIREIFRVTTPATPENAALLQQIQEAACPVCVHIRLGDYLDPANIRCMVCTREYYENAIRRMHRELTCLEEKYNEASVIPTFFVFTENPEVVKQWHLEEITDASGNVLHSTIVYGNPVNPDYEEFRLMYNCRHFIISNSTFSVWAQFMQENEKIVIAPDHWSNGLTENLPDQYQDGWILLET